MTGVFPATPTELLKLKPIWCRLLILRSNVVAAFAFSALKHNIVARHNSITNFRLSIADCSFHYLQTSWQSGDDGSRDPFSGENKIAISVLQIPYSTTSLMVPAPTVRPPSRIANRSPFSMAMGVINSISIATLSPGITISTPCGNVATPVTSVVRK